MNCVFKSCEGVDSQHHIIRECAYKDIRHSSHKDMLACRDKHVALLKRRLRDITASRYQAAPYFEVHLDFRRRVAFGPGEESGAYSDILDPCQVEALEMAQPIFGG